MAVAQTKTPEEAWMLLQDRATRESYVREVLDQGGDDVLVEIWMLRQPDHVRESYIIQVLEPKLHASKQ